MDEILTDWFQYPVKPVRRGYYEFRGWCYTAIVKMYFNGHTFGWHDPSDGMWVELADDDGDEWRGLASKP